MSKCSSPSGKKQTPPAAGAAPLWPREVDIVVYCTGYTSRIIDRKLRAGIERDANSKIIFVKSATGKQWSTSKQWPEKRVQAVLQALSQAIGYELDGVVAMQALPKQVLRTAHMVSAAQSLINAGYCRIFRIEGTEVFQVFDGHKQLRVGVVYFDSESGG